MNTMAALSNMEQQISQNLESSESKSSNDNSQFFSMLHSTFSRASRRSASQAGDIHKSDDSLANPTKLSKKRKSNSLRFRSRFSLRSLRSSKKIQNKGDTNSVEDISPNPITVEQLCSEIMQDKNVSNAIECLICCAVLSRSEFPDLWLTECQHKACHPCLLKFLKMSINEARPVQCFACSNPIHPNDVQTLLSDEDSKLLHRYEEHMVRRFLAPDPDVRWCPAPDCSFGVIATGCASCPFLKCQRDGCGTTFCYHCKDNWHPFTTCDQARAQRKTRDLIQAVGAATGDVYKPCPRCGTLIQKVEDGSCNHMNCQVCHCEFCWLCMKEISDLHYLSPSGCTFWGKKQWSRRKKIIWQLGTLVIAPLGIGLAAGLALPAMIIGIPVWVGKEVYSKLRSSNRHKRNVAVVGSVTGALIVSPLLASLAVSIGVPILLGYVYGIVPVSLCRGSTICDSMNGEDYADHVSDNQQFEEESVVNPSEGHPETSKSNNELNSAHSLSDIQPDTFDTCAVYNRTVSVNVHVLHDGASTNSSSTSADVTSHQRLKLEGDNMKIEDDCRESRASFEGVNSVAESLPTVDGVSILGLAGSLVGVRDSEGRSIVMDIDSDDVIQSTM